MKAPAPTFAEKNELGVYDATEVLSLPRQKKGWRGMDHASIALAFTSDGWRSARDYSFFTGDWRGAASPITDRSTAHATREDAIREQVDRLHRDCDGLTDPAMQREANAILAWCDNLIPAQPDLFGAAA